MAEACESLPDGPRLDALASLASMFPWPMGRERDERVGRDVAYLVDAVLAQLSRGRSALDVSIGEP